MFDERPISQRKIRKAVKALLRAHGYKPANGSDEITVVYDVAGGTKAFNVGPDGQASDLCESYIPYDWTPDMLERLIMGLPKAMDTWHRRSASGRLHRARLGRQYWFLKVLASNPGRLEDVPSRYNAMEYTQ